MDSYREHPSDFDPSWSSEASAPPREPAKVDIGTDERRMHVRAYNYWASLLDGRDFPSIEDLEPGEIEDFAPNSVLLDFTAGRENPATPYIGSAIREECGLGDGIGTIDQVPSRSLLSRLTDHYMQIIANRAPVGFEAEFENQRGQPICYRGILMPFSSDGDTIDFIYGVINWKRADDRPSEEPAAVAAPAPVEAEFAAEREEPGSQEPADPAPAPHFSWEDGPLHDADPDAPISEITLPADTGLADRLWAARETAEALKETDLRSRAALYRALAQPYDFALAAEREPQDYAELLDDSGVKAQVRAPMTPIVKLVFGIDYDKARLTEFAAALSYGRRQDVAEGGFLAFIEAQAGGLKALVAAERQARRPEAKPDTAAELARSKLREARPVALETVSTRAEFALVIARRRLDGGASSRSRS